MTVFGRDTALYQHGTPAVWGGGIGQTVLGVLLGRSDRIDLGYR